MGARVTGTSARKKTEAAVSATETPAPKQAVEDRITLATIGGKDYTAPANVPFGLTLKYLDLTMRFKPQYAQIAIVKELIGQLAFDELTTSIKDKADWKQLVDAAADHLLGAAEKEAGQGN